VAGDLYAVLGVPPAADARAVTLAYRRLVRRYHPDVSREPGAGARIRDINAAYEVLGDARRRLAYDRARVASAPPPPEAWAAAYRQWQRSTRPPPWAGRPEARLKVTPGAIDFGYVGRGEIAVRPVLARSLDGRPIEARVLTRGDWLHVKQSQVRGGNEVSFEVHADPRELSAFWMGAGPEEARVDGWLEVVDATGSVRVPAGAILRRDAPHVSWWNPFARKVS
jgi:hypothetical protein